MIKYFKLVYEFFSGLVYAFLATNKSKLAQIFRRKILKTECKIDKLVFIENKKNFFADKGSALYHGTHILNHNGKLLLGCKSHLGAYCHVNVCYGCITIGNNVAIGPQTNLVAYSNHYKKDKLVTATYLQKDIFIGNNVFIGSHVTVLPGSYIDDNVVIGANSLVKGHLKSGCIYAGAPAKFVKFI